MSLISDIIKALDHWTEWRELRELPQRFTELEARVNILETQCRNNPSNSRCEHCGSTNVEIIGSRPSQSRLGRFGVRETKYKFQEEDCGKETWIMDSPNS